MIIYIMQYYIAIKIHISEMFSIAQKKDNNKVRETFFIKFMYIFRNATQRRPSYGHFL